MLDRVAIKLGIPGLPVTSEPRVTTASMGTNAAAGGRPGREKKFAISFTKPVPNDGNTVNEETLKSTKLMAVE